MSQIDLTTPQGQLSNALKQQQSAQTDLDNIQTQIKNELSGDPEYQNSGTDKDAALAAYLATDKRVIAAKSRLQTASNNVRQWQASANGGTPRSQTEESQMQNNAANSPYGGVTDYQKAQLDARRAATAASNLNTVRSILSQVVAKDRNRIDEAKNILSYFENQQTTALKTYELSLQNVGMQLTQDGRIATFNASIYGTQIAALEHVLTSSVTMSQQAIDLAKEKQKAENAYYENHAPKGTSEYFRQVAMGNNNAPRPAGGIALNQPKQDFMADYKDALNTITQNNPELDRLRAATQSTPGGPVPYDPSTAGKPQLGTFDPSILAQDGATPLPYGAKDESDLLRIISENTFGPSGENLGARAQQ